MTQNQGWVKLYRKLLDNPLWTSEPFTKAQAWVDLLLLASHKDGNCFYKRGIKVVTNRGQLGYSMKSLCTRWRWSSGKVDRYLNGLQNENQIIYQTNDVTTIITILNYDTYQCDDIPNRVPNDNANEVPNEVPNEKQIEYQTRTNKNVKNIKNEKNYIDISNDISGKKANSTFKNNDDKKEEKVAKKEGKKKFIAPTIEEVANYCAERNNKVDAERFWHFYNENEWKRSAGAGKEKVPITSWKSCVILWEKQNKKFKQYSSQPQQKSIRAARAARALGKEI